MKKKFFKGILLAIFAGGAITACSSDNDETNIDGPDTGEVTAKFKHRVLIEDFTGAWCGWCPRVSHAIELLKEKDIVINELKGGSRVNIIPREFNIIFSTKENMEDVNLKSKLVDFNTDTTHGSGG